MLLHGALLMAWPSSPGAAAAAPIGEDAGPPNIVLLIADDLGYGELRFDNDGRRLKHDVPTPHLDRLAAESIIFSQAYVTASYCAPSRAAIFTGRMQNRFGFEFNPIGAENEIESAGLPESQSTLARYLHDQGYMTGLIGKWHLGATARNHPYRRGYDEFFGFLHEGHFYTPPPYRETISMLRRRALPDGATSRLRVGDRILTDHMGHDEPAYDANNPLLRGGQPVEVDQYLTDAFTAEAVSFIERNQALPFFLTVSYNAVHSPLQAKREDFEAMDSIDDLHRRIFAAMYTRLDASVGEILESLDDNGLSEQTLIFFLSDHGGPTRELTSSNAPLRGGKGNLFEGGIRVPFLAHWRGTIEPQLCPLPISSLDIAATVVDLTQARQARHNLANEWDGTSLRPLFDFESLDQSRQQQIAATFTSRTFYWRMGHRAALRRGEWKLVGERERIVNRPVNELGSSNEDDSAERERDLYAWKLFNIDRDIGETQELAERFPQIRAELIERWQELDSQMSPPNWQRGR